MQSFRGTRFTTVVADDVVRGVIAVVHVGVCVGIGTVPVVSDQ
jgi:hypothetical protein